jgi:hypothetical protein
MIPNRRGPNPYIEGECYQSILVEVFASISQVHERILYEYGDRRLGNGGQRHCYIKKIEVERGLPIVGTLH